MVSENVIVKNVSGLHLRPAGMLAKIAAQCKADLRIIKPDGTQINPKSVLMLMSAGIVCGTEITVTSSGVSEQEDLKTIVDAINSGLGE